MMLSEEGRKMVVMMCWRRSAMGRARVSNRGGCSTVRIAARIRPSILTRRSEMVKDCHGARCKTLQMSRGKG